MAKRIDRFHWIGAVTNSPSSREITVISAISTSFAPPPPLIACKTGLRLLVGLYSQSDESWPLWENPLVCHNQTAVFLPTCRCRICQFSICMFSKDPDLTTISIFHLCSLEAWLHEILNGYTFPAVLSLPTQSNANYRHGTQQEDQQSPVTFTIS